jgi:hypothetical protein
MCFKGKSECGEVCISTNELRKRVAAVNLMSSPASYTIPEDELLTERK